jgi:site-specific DNA-methyltransferase (adenine-specific)
MNSRDGSFPRLEYGINRRCNWDCNRPSPKYFKELFRVSQNQIIWGGNYFITDLTDTKTVIIWNKNISEGMSFSMFEMAWTSFDKPSKMFTLSSVQLDRFHPTQKPVKLYQWLLRNYAKPGDKILDTHMGSGNSIIACHDMGFEYMAFEIDEDYYKAAMKRINEHKAQMRFAL